ncbi:UAF4 [Auxenochlorella protothecoides x Auxenochlorella symbiontica]
MVDVDPVVQPVAADDDRTAPALQVAIDEHGPTKVPGSEEAVSGQGQASHPPAASGDVASGEKGEERRRDRHRDKESKRSERSRSRDRKKHRSSRRDDERRRSSRSRSRDRRRRSSRSRSRDRRGGDRSRRSRSRDRRDSRRSRSRDRRRERSRERRNRYRSSSSDLEYGYVPRRRGRGPPDPTKNFVDPFEKLRQAAAKAADPAEIQKQMRDQQMRARLTVLQQQAASTVQAASKTRRENLQLYIGNLGQGGITSEMLKQLFDSTMAVAFPTQVVPGMDAVVNCNVHSEGRYAFVELRTTEMATAALQLNGVVSLMGATLSIGRPSGYVDPTHAAAAARSAAQALARFHAETEGAAREGEAPLPSAFVAVWGAIAPGADEAARAKALGLVRGVCEGAGTVLQVVPGPTAQTATAGEEGAEGGVSEQGLEASMPPTGGAVAAEDSAGGDVPTEQPTGGESAPQEPLSETRNAAEPADGSSAPAEGPEGAGGEPAGVASSPSDEGDPPAAEPEAAAPAGPDLTDAVLVQFLEHLAAERGMQALEAAGGGGLRVARITARDWVAAAVDAST